MRDKSIFELFAISVSSPMIAKKVMLTGAKSMRPGEMCTPWRLGTSSFASNFSSCPFSRPGCPPASAL